MRSSWEGRGGGGKGRLYCEIGLAVEAREYVGDPGTGGNCDGDGDEGRSRVALDVTAPDVADMVVGE